MSFGPSPAGSNRAVHVYSNLDEAGSDGVEGVERSQVYNSFRSFDNPPAIAQAHLGETRPPRGTPTLAERQIKADKEDLEATTENLETLWVVAEKIDGVWVDKP